MKTPRKSMKILAVAAFSISVLLPAGRIAQAENVAQHAAQPHWVIDPAAPGDDLPPKGRSLFDYLVAQEGGGQSAMVVPFPFAALVRQLNAQLRRESPAKAVLIPLGRSLQRNSATPGFFAYPRAVVAADGEPATTRSLYAKDRLYLGYQEKANVLEVISYNEDAGRFEFQIVTDYRAGGTPRLAYANRVLCAACHQNAAPIFSRPVWDETNANPRIAAQLDAHRRDFYGIVVDRGIDIPNAIDDAALRANRFAALQLLWNEGCGGVDDRAIRCRAGIFAALLKYRLSAQQAFDRAEAAYRDDVAKRLLGVAQRRWPGGLALGNPDIPNRNPLPDDGPLRAPLAERDLIAYANVDAAFDPLSPRAPLETWRIASDDDVAGIVVGLSGFIADADVLALDRELFDRGAGKATPRSSHRATCRADPVPATGRDQRIEFRCTKALDPQGGAASFDGRVVVSRGVVTGGRIDRLQVANHPALHDIDLSLLRADTRGGERTAVFEPRRGALRARAPDGNAFERFELRWGRAGATATLVVREDFAAAREAVEALARDGIAGTFDGFGAGPFRRARLMPALLEGLGAAKGNWCCLDDSRLPPPQTARLQPPREGDSIRPVAEAHAAFYRYCGECHLSAERAPPNFLLGDALSVEARLRQCAPRMYARLSMWQRAPAARPKTPMPPEIALHRFEVGTQAWREGDALAGLMRSVDARLRSEGTSAAAVEALAAKGYESLRPCLLDDGPTPSQPQETGGSQQSRGTS